MLEQIELQLSHSGQLTEGIKWSEAKDLPQKRGFRIKSNESYSGPIYASLKTNTILPFQIAPVGCEIALPSASPREVHILSGTGVWEFSISPSHQIPARIPLYARHFLIECGDLKEGPVQLSLIKESALVSETVELSAWSFPGFELIGRGNEENEIEFNYSDLNESVLIRIQLLTEVPIQNDWDFLLSLFKK
jgi:hypothetical protein